MHVLVHEVHSSKRVEQDHVVVLRVRFQTREALIREHSVHPDILLHDSLFPGQFRPEFRDDQVMLEPAPFQNRLQVQNGLVEGSSGYPRTHCSPICRM